MIEKDEIQPPLTDIKIDSNKNKESTVQADQRDQPVRTEKTEVKNAHASGDGSIGKEDK